MKRHPNQHKVKVKEHSSVIPYPPGYKGQPLTAELIDFSDQLLNCPVEYRGLFMILIKQFALELGCGNSELSREYLTAIANGEVAIWNNEDLPAIVFVSIEEQHGCTRQRVLKIMPTLQLAEISGIVVDASEVTARANDAQTTHKTFAGVFH